MSRYILSYLISFIRKGALPFKISLENIFFLLDAVFSHDFSWIFWNPSQRRAQRVALHPYRRRTITFRGLKSCKECVI